MKANGNGHSGVENKFGTFSGVIMPSTLAILGAVMYYIAPQVLGSVGLFKMLIIILIAHSVTIATAFSISGIATNINVKGGGLYYLISRSLGSEFGGSLGILLFLAQTIASTFYSIAFARGIVSVLSSFNIIVPELYVSLIALMIFGIMVFIGARFVVKLQYLILAAIILSLVSIFLGPNTVDPTNGILVGTSAFSFWVAFAMYFPAVTGIDAGVGMSGELKDARKSLVRGTFVAIFFTMIVYIALIIKMSFAASPGQLSSDPYIIQKIAVVPQLVLLGVIMATSSSALSTLMTAPRCLRAMVDDKILPRFLSFLGKGIGKNKTEPRVAIIFSLIIAVGVLFSGGLEIVSQIVSMFFLSVYGWINGAAFFEKISQNPSYRPTFNAPVIISFFGMFACYAIMFLFNPIIMVVSIVFQLLVFYVLYKTKTSVKLESVWDGVFFQLFRKLLKHMAASEKSKKNWRPTIVAFNANEVNKTPLATVLHWISSKRGITKFYFLTQGDLKNEYQEREKFEDSMKEYVKEHELEIYPRFVMSDNFEDTITTILQTETLGDRPLNTVLIDFDRQMKLNKVIADMVCLHKNIIIMRNQTGFSNFKTIDVWWNTRHNGNFMIMLAYLITHSRQWLEQKATVRIFKVVEDDKDEQYHREELEKIIAESRMENVELHILTGKEEDMKDIINEHSQHSDLVLLGIPGFRERKSDEDIIEGINNYTEKLKVSLVVMAFDKIDFRIH
ncbi:hypothetical protein ACFL0W_00395 [Nanoarchaeota archaeon]